ncbi:TPA: pyridoxal-dependent decarboxylase [Vibrio vulnificus]|uniref:pyridoxal-dependent decarboxylase n=1 Tax=Vibrio vulnificus TaxID=672 RepID=UPI000929EDD7|nr:pyridoxal-dependent decarboxylase [Vibrio vulnificus]MCU8414989.1 pyridoxal-dependent decarboxylase [Vibrio vulnificus]MCU8434500.1 pyridoxal-dependent decarboxylase [Vibrio vulnificus]MCU8438768.1 pyridoxal-dependent decarboxylase [Vibrio vulnificus]MDK2607856.1 pyridoxal-dependent decarboxylase [Vibrio vulnificus]MDK2612251.1 pyridoxal-dependent decarboxylase [Vibrio vulnificus]
MENKHNTKTGYGPDILPCDEEIPYGPEQLPWKKQVPDFAQGLISPPDADPIEVYRRANQSFGFEVDEIHQANFEIPPTGQNEDEQDTAFSQVQQYVNRQKARFLGYQTEEKIDYGKRIAPFLDVSMNNVGDPFVDGNYTINTKFVERMVLDYFASLWNAKWPSQGPYLKADGSWERGDPESYWGYVLTMGSTEGNLYAMLNARDYLSGQTLLDDEICGEDAHGRTITTSQLYAHYPQAPQENPNAYTPVAFFSEDTHYSIVKAMSVEKIETFGALGNRLYPNDNPLGKGELWPAEVPSEAPAEGLPVGSGAIDVDKLVKYVEFFAEKGYPIIVVLNYGTTFKGAYDNIDQATLALETVLKKHGLYERQVPVDPSDPSKTETRTGYWIHVDGALGASYMPFVKMAANLREYEGFFEENHCYTGPDFDFRNPMVHSIVTSGHKWPGAPWPTGVYMTKHQFMVSPPDNPAYIGSPDTTFAGSRSGISSLILWDYFAKHSYEKQIELAMKGQKMAQYAYEKLQEVANYWEDKGADIGVPKGLWLQRTPLSLSLIFCQPKDDIIFKYSLAKEEIDEPNPETGRKTRKYVHMFTMWDVTEKLIDELCDDLKADDAFNVADFKPLTNVRRTRDLPHSSAHLVKLPLKGRSFR